MDFINHESRPYIDHLLIVCLYDQSVIVCLLVYSCIFQSVSWYGYVPFDFQNYCRFSKENHQTHKKVIKIQAMV